MKKSDSDTGDRLEHPFTKSASTLRKGRTTVDEMSTSRTSRRDHPSSDESKSTTKSTIDADATNDSGTDNVDSTNDSTNGVTAETVGTRTKRRAAEVLEKALAATAELAEAKSQSSTKPRRARGAKTTDSTENTSPTISSTKSAAVSSTKSASNDPSGKRTQSSNERASKEGAMLDEPTPDEQNTVLHELGDDEAPWLPTDTVVEFKDGDSLVIHDIPGPANAPVIFLQHGWTVTANLNFFRIYRQLAKKYRVIAFDIRGHGQGIRPRAFFRLEDCADDCVAVADVLGIDRFVAVGYSMGGTIAQLAAHRHPTRVRGVVLCATSKRFRSQGKDRVLWEGSMGLTAAVLTLAPHPVRQQLLSRYLLVHKDEMPSWMLNEVRRNDAAMVAQAGLALGRYDASSWIGELGRDGSSGIPASVVITTKDKTVPTVRQRKLAATLSGGSFHEVDADHRAAVTDPELFLPALLAALQDVTR